MAVADCVGTLDEPGNLRVAHVQRGLALIGPVARSTTAPHGSGDSHAGQCQ